ncbi:UNVERIFIED_CONTAM: hypothetical protein FKN15_013590 [Acipenser sinensis]
MVFSLLTWAQRNLLSLQATHIPGVVNWAVDSAGTVRIHQSGDSTLIVERIWERFGKMQVDLFTSAGMTHCPLWYSLHRLGGPLGVDALVHEWPKAFLYAFPPISLLPAFLASEASVLLVRIWFSTLCQLLNDQPWDTPLRLALLSQARGTLWHPEPGDWRLRPPRRTVLPEWSLNIVLEALTKAQFEPIHSINLKYLSMKTAFLMVISSANRVSELQVLPVHSSCMRIREDGSRMFLRINTAFHPKVITAFHINQSVELESFHPPPFASMEDERLNFLCPLRALRCYVDRTRALHQSDQLFVCHGTQTLGQPLSMQRLSHWIVDSLDCV